MRTSTSEKAAGRPDLRAVVRGEAARLGFEAVGFTTPDSIPQADARLRDFVARGWHGSMEWMAETLERRASRKRIGSKGTPRLPAGSRNASRKAQIQSCSR